MLYQGQKQDVKINYRWSLNINWVEEVAKWSQQLPTTIQKRHNMWLRFQEGVLSTSWSPLALNQSIKNSCVCFILHSWPNNSVNTPSPLYSLRTTYSMLQKLQSVVEIIRQKLSQKSSNIVASGNERKDNEGLWYRLLWQGKYWCRRINKYFWRKTNFSLIFWTHLVFF